MRRAISANTEIFNGGDKAFAEKVRPDAIHENARGKRVFSTHEPLCEVETVAIFSTMFDGRE